MTIEGDPKEDRAAFAGQVKAASTQVLQELVGGERRAAILADLAAGMPDAFRADRAGSLRAVVHWHVSGGSEGDDVFEVRIADGRCAVGAPSVDTPELALYLDAVDFVRMTTGNAGARMLFLRGRMRVRGDLGLVNRLPALFDVPKP